ncbi:hypothetical protein [Streptomyces sp. NPDC054783]
MEQLQQWQEQGGDLAAAPAGAEHDFEQVGEPVGVVLRVVRQERACQVCSAARGLGGTE